MPTDQTPPIDATASQPFVHRLRGEKDAPFPFPRANAEQVKDASIMVIAEKNSTTESLQDQLNSAGFSNILSCTDSTNAVNKIIERLPDVIILDLVTPVDGVEILTQIRKLPATSRIPVVTFAADFSVEMRTRLLNLGANDFLHTPIDTQELVARVRNRLAAKIAFDDLAERSAQLQAEVLQDSLTGLANRRAFDFELNRRVTEWERQRSPVSLLLIDVDHFKRINDHYGHHTGDLILVEFANIIKMATRKMDLPCRIGGEEFAVILPSTHPQESKQLAERVRLAIEDAQIKVQQTVIRLTASFGIANAMKGDDSALIYRRADTALYTSKQRGRNCSTLHNGTKCVAVTANLVHDETTSKQLPAQQSGSFNIHATSILIIDDEPPSTAAAKRYLQQGGFDRIQTMTNSKIAWEEIRQSLPDLVLLGVDLPGSNGIEILQQIRSNPNTCSIPVVILTSPMSSEIKEHALAKGANDFLDKPIKPSELLTRVRNTMMAKAHFDLVENYNTQLEHEVQLRTQQLASSRREVIQCLARASELREDRTGQHVLRIGCYAAIVARQLGFTGEQVVDLEHAAQLHDIGKIGVADTNLSKPDRLSRQEYEAMKDHCRMGSNLIRDTPAEEGSKISHLIDECSSPVMRLAALVAETHHEKWDGSGYPRGLKGEAIPIEGRITAICDVFDAISTPRPYQQAFPLDECFEIIEDGRGSHFDPAVVDAFFARQDEIVQAYTDFVNHSR
jgi:putative two-component system response regulator